MSRRQLKAWLSEVGEEKLGAILKDFYRQMSEDVLVGFFFDGKDVDAIAAKQLEFVLVAMGGRPTYTGKAPASAHRELPPILKGHFDRRLILLRRALESHGVSEKNIEIYLKFENAFRGVVQT